MRITDVAAGGRRPPATRRPGPRSAWAARSSLRIRRSGRTGARASAAGLQRRLLPRTRPSRTPRRVERAFAAENVVIAEVGAWKNMLDPDAAKRKENLDYVTERWPWPTPSARAAAWTSPAPTTRHLVRHEPEESVEGVLRRDPCMQHRHPRRVSGMASSLMLGLRCHHLPQYESGRASFLTLPASRKRIRLSAVEAHTRRRAVAATRHDHVVRTSGYAGSNFHRKEGRC